jgi:hypothetical protein
MDLAYFMNNQPLIYHLELNWIERADRSVALTKRAGKAAVGRRSRTAGYRADIFQDLITTK